MSAASNLPIFRSVAPVNAPRSWPNNSLARSSSESAAQLRQTKGPLRRGLEKWTARATSSLPTPLSPRIKSVALLAAARAISSVIRLIDVALADDLALHAEPLAKLDVLVADLGEMLGQFLLPREVGQGNRHRVGHGQRELQVLGVGNVFGVGRVEMDQTEDHSAAADRSADHAGGGNLPPAVPTAHGTVAQHVARQNRFAFAHHRGGQEIRHAVVAAIRGGAAGDHLQVGGARHSLGIAGNQ